ncbi:hypothetical protein HMI56_005713 [Coelomomyces lativittatus]|nr:hypothetical protein HMI56_005713 [Coelomomyces lativittatus]
MHDIQIYLEGTVHSISSPSLFFNILIFSIPGCPKRLCHNSKSFCEAIFAHDSSGISWYILNLNILPILSPLPKEIPSLLKLTRPLGKKLISQPSSSAVLTENKESVNSGT